METNSLIASEKGLQLVNDAIRKKEVSWKQTDKRFLETAEVSRATLSRL